MFGKTKKLVYGLYLISLYCKGVLVRYPTFHHELIVYFINL